MARIECPICRNDVRGADQIELSQNLKMHMADVHRMKNIGVGSIESSSSRKSYSAASSYAESGRAHISSRPPRAPEPSYPVVGRIAGGRTMVIVRKERGEVRHRAGGTGERRNAEVNCPLCGRLLQGADEDDLSDRLEEHMNEAHDIRPRLSTHPGMS